MIKNEVHMSNDYKYSIKECCGLSGKGVKDVLRMVSMGELVPLVFLRRNIKNNSDYDWDSPHTSSIHANIKCLRSGKLLSLSGKLIDPSDLSPDYSRYIKNGPDYLLLDIAPMVLDNWTTLPQEIFEPFWRDNLYSIQLQSIPYDKIHDFKIKAPVKLPEEDSNFVITFDPHLLITRDDIWFPQSEVKKAEAKNQIVKTSKAKNSNPELGLIFWRAFTDLEKAQSFEPRYKQVWETVYDEIETERQLNEAIPKKRTYDPHEHIFTIDSINTPSPKLNWLIADTDGRVSKQGTLALKSLPAMISKLKRNPPKIKI